MKRLLLSVFAAASLFAVSAGELNSLFNANLDYTYDGFKTSDVLTDADGNVVAVGAFDDQITLGSNTFEAIGTSAYVAKYNSAGTLDWGTAIVGSVSVSDLVSDSDGNIYVVGNFADEVVFNSTNGDAVVKTGMEIYGEPTVKKNASFIAKYDHAGAVIDVFTFIPEALPELASNPMYEQFDGDAYFRIGNVQVVGGKLYASALFAGHTQVGSATFDGTYNDPWFGMFFVEVKNAAVLSLSFDDKGKFDAATCQNIVSCCVPEVLETFEEAYEVGAVNFTVYNGDVYAAFAGNGPLVVTAGSATKTIDATFQDYNYIFIKTNGTSIAGSGVIKCPEAGMAAEYVPVSMFVNNMKLYVVGYESFAENYGEGNQENVSKRIFVFSTIVMNLGYPMKKTFDTVDGDINYDGVRSVALLPSGEICMTANGYYTSSNEDHYNGDFARETKTFLYNNNAELETYALVPDAVSVSAAGKYLAFSKIAETGTEVSLYGDGVTGVEEIAISTDAPAVYYNFQGVEVTNPENGIFIVRRGSKVSKELLRR